MTTTQNIPLKKLVLWNGNVRKTEGSDTGLAELAASIQSVGIINPLTVFPKGKRFAVVAGGRRLAALERLLNDKTIDDGFEVPCTFTTEETDSEVSIAENVVREDMHPADEFEAFLKLSKDGVPNEDIAARFGTTKTVVEKRLKLANVSRKIIAAYRKGDLDLECVMAYAVTDDVKRQEKVFKSLSRYHANDADSIRGALTDGEIDATDKRVRFVTLQAYEQAGGKTRRDLFADEDDAGGIYVLDAGLLEELVAAKLETAAKALCEEGWNWVEVRSDFGWDAKSKFKQLREEPLPLSPELTAEHERLEDELDKLYDGDDELTDEQSARADEITARIDEIESVREFAWPEGPLEVAGAIVTPGHDGQADITRGLVRPEDVKRLRNAKTAADSTDDGTAKQRTLKPGLPAKLVEQLTRHRTAAIAAELIDKPAVGLATVTYCFALELFGNGKTCVHVSLRRQLHDAVEGSAAFERIGQARARWADTIPGTPEDLWTWCLEQERDVLIDLLTFCAATSVDAVVRKRGSMDSGTSLAHSDDLALELGLDMTEWFTPNAENYFRHVSKAQILDALQDAKGELAPAWHKAKKAELAGIAERQIAGTNWLPEILRTPDDSAHELQEAA